MIPTQYVALPELPLSLNGKIDRLALSNYELPKSEPQTSNAAVNTTQEKLLSILEKYNISIDDGALNINDQLDSFTFINLVIDIEIEFGIEINDDLLVYEVFLESTLDSLINYIDEKSNI
jgi:acyl carrier protein